MEERIIRLPELITYHQINEVWEESIACFCTKSDMKNISKIPPVLADMFSFIVVEEGMAIYSIIKNIMYRKVICYCFRLACWFHSQVVRTISDA